jgi:hypothetical protein
MTTNNQSKWTQEDRAEAVRRLLKDYKIKPTQTVFTTCVSARSGCSHLVELRVVDKGKILNITGLVARACGMRLSRSQYGIRMQGGGMDMAMECVYLLGLALWPNGTRKPHSIRNGKPDTDGGFALRNVRL